MKDEKYTEDEIKEIIKDRKDNKIFKKNQYLKTNEFKKKYAESLFWILTKYWKSYMDRGFKFKYNDVREKSKKEYAVLSDEFTEWIDDRYEITNDKKDIIKIADIWDRYKNGSYYSNLSRRDKRKNNKKCIIQKLMESPLYGKLYVKRFNSLRHLLRGVKKRVDILVDDDDDDVYIDEKNNVDEF